MQNIENDMDDLFRRAAENYPLNAGTGDWDKIDKKLAALAEKKAIHPKSKILRYKKLLFVLLLFISLAVWVMLLKTPGNTRQASVATKRHIPPTASVASKAKKESGDHQAGVNRARDRATVSGAQNAKDNGPIAENTRSDAPGTTAPVFAKRTLPKADQKIVDTTFNTGRNENETPNGNPVAVVPDHLPNLKPTRRLGTDKMLAPTKRLVPTKTGKSKNNGSTVQHHFYISLISDLDFSKVKSSRFEGPAFGIGMMGGYQINQHLFVETGLVRFHKNYYSLGTNFSEAQVAMPSGMVINDLESQSKILEIPLKAGLYVYDKKKTRFFIATGPSAYIMINEKNRYNVTMNGTPEKMEGVYKKHITKMPAVINISGGWQQPISNSFTVTIEPYIKLPLQGIGVGKLPVTSAGIQIGISGRRK